MCSTSTSGVSRRVFGLAAAVLCLAASSGLPARADAVPAQFASSTGVHSENHPSTGYLESADMDGDGVLDLVYSYKTRGSTSSQTATWEVAWVKADGTGGSAAVMSAQSRPQTGWDGIGALAVGDVNGDGFPDIVVGTAVDGVWIVLNTNSSGTLANPWWMWRPNETIPLPHSFPNVHDLELGDLDGDGDLDILMALGEYDTGGATQYGLFSALMNHGQGAVWSRVDISSADSKATSVAVGDLLGNGGALEMVLAGSMVYWAEHSGGTDAGATFSAYKIAKGTSGLALLARTGDLNNDGKLDIVTTWPDSSSAMSQVLYYPNQGGSGSGVFVASTYERIANPSKLPASDMRVADFNQDGNDDVALAVRPPTTPNQNALVALTNPGGNGFASGAAPISTQTTLNLGGDQFARAIAVGLFQSEGDYDPFPDLIVASSTADSSSTGGGSVALTLADNQTVDAFKPGVDSILSKTGRLIEITFTLPMTDDALDTGKYTLSGSGQNTLADNPAKATRVSDTQFDLQWTGGAMGPEDSLTVTVDGSLRGQGFNVPMSAGSGPFSAEGQTVDVPQVKDGEAQDSQSILVTYNVHVSDGAATPGNYTISGKGQGTLNANPDAVTKQSDTEYLLTWNDGTMVNNATVTLTVNAATSLGDDENLVWSVDGIPFTDTPVQKLTGVAVSPLADVSAPNPQVTNVGPVVYQVSYYKPGAPDVTISDITLSPDNILLKATTKAGRKANATADIAVDEVDGHPNRRTVTLSNMAGDGQLSFSVVGDDTARDAAGNPVVVPSSWSSRPVEVDNTAPDLVLTAQGPLTIEQHDTFDPLVDENGNPRATASDPTPDGGARDITHRIMATPNPLDTSQAGAFSVQYTVSDEAGNAAAPVGLQVNVQAADWTLTVQDADGGTATPETGKHGYDDGEAATLTATADNCFAFSGWAIDGDTDNLRTDNPLSLTMDADHTAAPVFEAADCDPAVELIWPNGGEQWPLGKTVQVLWNNYAADAGSTSSISVYDFSHGGRSQVVATGVSNDGDPARYDWDLANFAVQNAYKMGVTWTSNADATDKSDAYFSIVESHNDVNAYAKHIELGQTGAEDRFDYSGDEDWYYFFATKGVSYTLATSLGDKCDTALALYDRDGTTLLESNDNASQTDLSSLISDWEAPYDHTYYIQVTVSPDSPYPLDFGPGTDFTLTVTESQKQGQSDPYATIHGTVTDAASGAPINRAQVALPGIGGLTAFTDASGAYEIPGLASMVHEVTASADGYYSARSSVHLAPGEQEELNFVLAPGEAAEGEGEGEGEWVSVTTSVNEGGSISPDGMHIIRTGETLHVAITPGPCHMIADVMVDGESVGATASYVFDPVTQHHTIEARFAAVQGLEPARPLFIEASQGLYPGWIRVMWQPSDGANVYQVWRATTADFADGAALSDWLTETWYDDILNPPDAPAKQRGLDRYYYRVVAANACGESQPSDIAEGYTVSADGLPAPTNVAATVRDSGDWVEITWDAVEGAAHYIVYRNEKDDFATADSISPWIADTRFEDYSLGAEGPRFGCFRLDTATRYYWVVASGEGVGDSPPSDSVHARLTALKTVYEPAMPSTQNAEGVRLAAPDAPLAVRLRADAPIDAASVWGAVRGQGVEADATAYWPVDAQDGWVVCMPETPWPAGAVLTMEAGAATVSGAAWTVEFQFLVAATAGKQGGTALTGPELGPDWTDNDAPLGPAALAEAVDASPLPNGLGPVWAVGPDEAYASARRVWLPLPEGVAAEACTLWYLLDDAEAPQWAAAADVAGWMVPGSALVYEAGGVAWLGVAVRHGGVVQLAPVDTAAQGAGVLPQPGLGRWLPCLLAAAVLGCWRRGRRKVRE